MRKACVVLSIVLLSASAALAGSINIDQWYEFGFGGAGSWASDCSVCSLGPLSVAADTSPWTFTAPAGGVSFRITDAFLTGDSFTLYDNALAVGSTPVVAALGYSCDNDELACMADPLMSNATFFLGAGAHSITIYVDNSPYGSGAGFFQVVAVDGAVPEPATCALLGCGLAALGLMMRRRRRT